MSNESDENQNKAEITGLPTFEFYDRTYARSMDGNDQKALSVFKNYEAKEKIRRLHSEIMWIKNEIVPETILDRIVGKKRAAKHQSYKHWAELMLIWLSAKK